MPGTVPFMDLAYPPEAEEFRTEIAAWLKANLPDGWGGPGSRGYTPRGKPAQAVVEALLRGL